ncbi:unnamed protein product [Durusdinium trenchii]|uniref:Uncharacterized protein n=2 Tax=Durusdinium trenchii TaxID=1381693 RepID=A0ABP0QHP9_9DINO
MGAEQNEFRELDWADVGRKYCVANYLMASYYRSVLAVKRQLTVDVDRKPVSCTDLLLRALPYLLFPDVVVATIGKDNVLPDVSQEQLAFEIHYAAAVIRVLKRLGVRAYGLESPSMGKICRMQGSTFAIEAVMASRRAADIEEHRNRFDQVTNYAKAKHKCLLIIGRHDQDSKLRKLVRDTWGGIEIVGLAANSAHTGYHVYVKQQEQQGKEVLDFCIPCDGVARSFSFKDEEPFFEISSAQKFKSIQPGWISLEHSNIFKLTGLCFERCQNV